jgi:hypothetical protein
MVNALLYVVMGVVFLVGAVWALSNSSWLAATGFVLCAILQAMLARKELEGRPKPPV